MKNIFFVVMLGVVLALGMGVVGCDTGCSKLGVCSGTYGSASVSTCGDSKCAVQVGKEGPAGTTVTCNCP
jgi:hypothetical protein